MAECRHRVIGAPELAHDAEDAGGEMQTLCPVAESERIGDDAQMAQDVLPLILNPPQVVGGADEMLAGEERRGGA